MKPVVAPVVADSERLLKEVVRHTAKFPQHYKHMLGAKIVELALESVLQAQEAARAGKRNPEQQLVAVNALIKDNDRLQAMLQVAYDLKCFTSTGAFDEVIKVAAKVGAQCGGWLNQIKKALPDKQNPSASTRAERLGALSSGVASAEAKS